MNAEAGGRASRPAAERALFELQLESASLYDDVKRIEAEVEVTEAAVRELGLDVTRFLLLACGPSDHHLVRLRERHPRAEVVALDLSLPFLAMARQRAAGARFAVADMAELPLAGGSLDLLGLYGNSFGFFDDSGNAALLREAARCLQPGGVAVITVPCYEHVAGFTAAAPLVWRETADTLAGRLRGMGERYYDSQRGVSVGRYELHNETTGERFVRTDVASRVYPFSSPDPLRPGIAEMAGEAGFSSARLVPLAPSSTKNAKGLMERMDCVVLTRSPSARS